MASYTKFKRSYKRLREKANVGVFTESRNVSYEYMPDT